MYGSIGATLGLNGKFQPPPLHFSDATIGLSLGLEAAYEPKLIKVKGKICIGGKISSEFQIRPELKINEISGKIYGGVSFTVWSFKILNEEFVLFEHKWVNNHAQQLFLLDDVRIIDDTWVYLPIKNDGVNFNFYKYMLLCDRAGLLSSWKPRVGYSQNVMDILSHRLLAYFIWKNLPEELKNGVNNKTRLKNSPMFAS